MLEPTIAVSQGRRPLPRTVVALGFVALLMDVSSEMVHALLPVFLVGTLGASVVAVGLIEGIAEATASISRLFSGVVSDWVGRRKPLVLLGYGLAAATKPLFPLASDVGAVLTARFLDRIGKGIRGAPRDALIADVTTPDQRGAAYGLRQAMDTVGAFAGPLLAVVLMLATADDVRLVFWIAVLPALCRRRPDPVRRARTGRQAAPGAAPLSAPPRRAGAAACRLLAHACRRGRVHAGPVQRGIPVLRAQDAGLPVAWVPMVIVAMNLVYAGGAYPLGVLADRMDRGRLLALGLPCSSRLI